MMMLLGFLPLRKSKLIKTESITQSGAVRPSTLPGVHAPTDSDLFLELAQ
jgi:hypothetical protein